MSNVLKDAQDRAINKYEGEMYTKVMMMMQLIKDPIRLRNLQKQAKTLHDEIRKKEVRGLGVGSKVTMLNEYQHRKPYGVVGTIKKIKITKCDVQFGNTVYICPMAMLQKAS